MDSRLGRLLRPPLIAGVLIATNLVLALGLAASALRPRPVLVLPSTRAEGELLPGAVPAETAREFALRYVLHFDNYTPATLDATQQVLQRMIGARSWSGASQALEKRRQVVQEGRMASQVIPISTRVDGLTVTVDAVRRVFISDRLSRESKVRYDVTLERQPPTDPNPFGLGVVSQIIHEDPAALEKDK
ncbi:MAG TPA: TraE/TraK family type IV conjugative transfer system protein [Planctomycetota bacterium]|nr:TraE/TraK family type IV conjugative transfer system protein [Planctomycetota bacterium]